MPRKRGAEKPDDLREACIEEAARIIAEKGVEALSMREVSRNLGVSHQAPYKHFASRDHILAEVVRRAYTDFAQHLDAQHAAVRANDPQRAMEAMGQAYLAYAATHPLQYRLMFNTPLPDPNAHPDMTRDAQHAFHLLRDAVAAMQRDTPPDHDALFIWAVMHGMAGILQMQALQLLTLPPETLDAAVAHTMAQIRAVLFPDHPGA